MWFWNAIGMLKKMVKPVQSPTRRIKVTLPETKFVGEESIHRKRATELKKQKRFREAAAEMWLSFKALQKIGDAPGLENLYRYPKYLYLAGDYAECAVACERMAEGKLFGSPDAGGYASQRTRVFCSLAADAYEAMGNTDLAGRFRQRVENAGSDNQVFVDKQVKELLDHGFTIAIVRDGEDSDHPAYQKLKGTVIRLTDKDKRKYPLYSKVRETGIFADDDNPVGIEYCDEVFDVRPHQTRQDRACCVRRPPDVSGQRRQAAERVEAKNERNEEMTRTVVASSNLRSVGYDPAAMTLEVEFHDGGVYQYRGVPGSVHAGLMGAASKGSYLASHIKNRYPTIKIR